MSNKTPVDQDLIRAIADLLNEANLAEIEVEQDNFRVRVTRTPAGSAEVVQYAAPPVPGAPSTAAPPQPPAAPEVAPPAVPAPAAAEDLSSHPGVLTSPMVGTAYRAPEPGAPPYVEVGSTVTEGQTVLIIEAMKTMNHIPANRSGKITRVLVEDAQPVEYGEPLVIIE